MTVYIRLCDGRCTAIRDDMTMCVRVGRLQMIADQMITYRILIIFLELVSLGTATWALSARAFVGPPGREKRLEGGLRRLWVDTGDPWRVPIMGVVWGGVPRRVQGQREPNFREAQNLAELDRGSRVSTIPIHTIFV